MGTSPAGDLRDASIFVAACWQAGGWFITDWPKKPDTRSAGGYGRYLCSSSVLTGSTMAGSAGADPARTG
jgi:hypothetical protein